MTAPSKNPSAIERTRKRLDTTPKPKKAGKQAAHSPSIVRQYVSTTTTEGAAATSPNKPLTEKQKLFVKHWAQGESMRSAAIKAGYSEGGMSIVYRMVEMPNVLALYEREKKLYEEASQMTRKKVMDGLLEAINMAKIMSEPASMVSGWREIGKMCGYYAPVEKKVKISVQGRIVHDRLNRLSDAELLKLIQEGASSEGLDVTPNEMIGYEDEDDEEE